MSFSRLQLPGRGRQVVWKPPWARQEIPQYTGQHCSNIRSNHSCTCHASAFSPGTQRPRAPAEYLLLVPFLPQAPFQSRQPDACALACPLCSVLTSAQHVIWCLSEHTFLFSLISLKCALYPFLREGFSFPLYLKKCSLDKQTGTTIQWAVIQW